MRFTFWMWNGAGGQAGAGALIVLRKCNEDPDHIQAMLTRAVGMIGDEFGLTMREEDLKARFVESVEGMPYGTNCAGALAVLIALIGVTDGA